MATRNRSTGWQYAKLSGHKNEDKVKELLDTEKVYCSEFLKRVNCSSKNIREITIGGLHETNVEGVLNHKTKSKTDMKLLYTDGSQTNISIKKSLGGQVYLVKASAFIQIFEKQFSKTIPSDVKRAMQLFWAEAPDATTIIKKYASIDDFTSYEMQLRHKSLNACTLFNYDKSLYNNMLCWFKENAFEITKLAFSMGAARDKTEWTDFVWYINLMGDVDIDDLFSIPSICSGAMKNSEDMTFYGDKNGGTTIQLPFGFVQWHQSQMQFHHNYEKVEFIV